MVTLQATAIVLCVERLREKRFIARANQRPGPQPRRYPNSKPRGNRESLLVCSRTSIAQYAQSERPCNMPKKKQQPQSGASETKEQKLVRLANVRVPKAIASINRIGNLASYKPSQEQSARIISALSEAIKSVSARLSGVKTGSAFSLEKNP